MVVRVVPSLGRAPSPGAPQATTFGKIGEAFAEADGAAAASVQAYFKAGGDWDALSAGVSAVAGDADVPKGVRKAAKAFLAATSATLESYNTGAFDKAFEQWRAGVGLSVSVKDEYGIVQGARRGAAAAATWVGTGRGGAAAATRRGRR